MILTGDGPAAMAAAWQRATAMIDQQADELSPALLNELRRFLRLAERGLLRGETFDFDAAIAEHERRVALIMDEGTQRTARVFALDVLGGLDQGSRIGSWVRTTGVGLIAATFAREGAERFARWTAHHLRRVMDLRADQLERALFRQRGVDAPRRALNAAEDRTHLASQWATASAAEFSGEIDQRVWLSRLDGRERPTHNHAHGQHCPMSGAFIVGGYRLRWPRDPNGPIHEIANCRCVSAIRRKK